MRLGRTLRYLREDGDGLARRTGFVWVRLGSYGCFWVFYWVRFGFVWVRSCGTIGVFDSARGVFWVRFATFFFDFVRPPPRAAHRDGAPGPRALAGEPPVAAREWRTQAARRRRIHSSARQHEQGPRSVNMAAPASRAWPSHCAGLAMPPRHGQSSRRWADLLHGNNVTGDRWGIGRMKARVPARRDELREWRIANSEKGQQ